MKNKIRYSLLLLCLFGISFLTGYFYTEWNTPHTVSAVFCEYIGRDLTLMDENGELWAFCDVSEPSKDSTFEITYKGHFRLLKLTCDGQEIPFV